MICLMCYDYCVELDRLKYFLNLVYLLDVSILWIWFYVVGRVELCDYEIGYLSWLVCFCCNGRFEV